MILASLIAVGMSFPSLAENPAVRTIGSQKDVMMKDDRVAKISLADLEPKNLFAVGPREGLDGEITVVDGNPFVTRISTAGRISTEHAWKTKAVFLVSANVPSWSEVELRTPIAAMPQLQAIVEDAARRAGLDPEKPFPFQLKGEFAEVEFHILRGTDPQGKNVPGGDRVMQTVKSAKGALIGFFSKHHQGVFTHKDSFIHVHFAADDGTVSGHVDGLKTDAKAKFKLSVPTL